LSEAFVFAKAFDDSDFARADNVARWPAHNENEDNDDDDDDDEEEEEEEEEAVTEEIDGVLAASEKRIFERRIRSFASWWQQSHSFSVKPRVRHS
jgi:hypothetical protein